MIKRLWLGVIVASISAAGGAEQLRYQLPVGLIRHCKINVAATGEVKSGVETRPLSLKSALRATEEVTKQGPGALAVLTVVWDEAEFEVYGEQGNLAPGVAKATKTVDPWGGVQDVRIRGRRRAAAHGEGFEIDVDQLDLIDLLVEMAQWPQFPRKPVEAGATWVSAEKSPFPDLEAESNARTTVVSLKARGDEVAAELRTDAKVKATLEMGEVGALSGEITGTITQTFLCRAGKLESGDARWHVELSASEGGGLQEDRGRSEARRFALKGDFVVLVEYED